MCKRSWLLFQWLNKWPLAELLGTKRMTDVSVPSTHANLSPSLCKLCATSLLPCSKPGGWAATESILLGTRKTCHPVMAADTSCAWKGLKILFHSGGTTFVVIIQQLWGLVTYIWSSVISWWMFCSSWVNAVLILYLYTNTSMWYDK